MTGTEHAVHRSLRTRIRENQRPAAVWVAVLLALVALEAGALVDLAVVLVQGMVKAWPFGNPGMAGIESAKAAAEAIPTLLSRETIPNQGWRTSANGPWTNTFLGLEPMVAWLLRFALTYAYVGVLIGWFLYGYRLYREHYRQADWTPTDDVVRRFRSHSWGKFGFVVVVVFVVMAVFAPTLSPALAEENIENPYSYEMQYFDEETGSVETVFVGQANSQSTSQGAGDDNIGLWQYDDFGRFHPFGTMPNGKDLFTFMMYGARVSLFIGLLSMGIMGAFATVFAMTTAYYKGLVDLAVVIVGDSVMSIPQLLLLILAMAVFNGHWLEGIYNGGLLIALVFGLSGWPGLWRAVRGPAFQVSTEEWVDAARSFGQRPSATMRKHMLPYVVGYLLVYASMTLGGVIIGTAALSFLGIGIDAPTPEWGRAVSLGQPFIATQSWHIAMIPGLLVVAVVTAFNALGDGIRDAIDPQSEGGESETTAAAAGGGGG
ncbi:ABC transporter permease [Halobacteria archaeon HArc-gm2]|nr:ABC transporter permease [Halobacteria archaeon HArc-gm2]